MKAKETEDDPNRLIREFLDPKRVPTEEELNTILDHVARAPFASREIEVDREIRGKVFLGQELRTTAPSLIAHLAKRVLLDQQWSGDTTPERYLTDLRSVIGGPGRRMAVYTGRDGHLYLGLFAESNLPSERLGPRSEAFLWVIYAADYGTIVSGYQVSGVEAITLPARVRWL